MVKEWERDFQYQLICSHDTAHIGGLLIGFYRSLNVKILNVTKDHRFLLVRCVIMDEEYTLVNVYSSHLNAPKAKSRFPKFVSSTDQFSRFLQDLWKAVHKFPAFKVLVGGDFNAVSDIELDVLGSKDRTWRQSFTSLLQSFIDETGLTDVWRAFHPDEVQVTC